MEKIIFFDMDGVLVNWNKRAMELLNINQNEVIPKLTQGKRLEELYPNLHSLIENSAQDFWSKLELFPWTNDLLNLGKKYGEIALLTSGGNPHKKYPSVVADANAGKTKYVAKHFQGIPLILTKQKYFCASKNSLLIDDTKEKIDEFQNYGGQVFHFPQEYSILSEEVNVKEVFGNLEKKLQSF